LGNADRRWCGLGRCRRVQARDKLGRRLARARSLPSGADAAQKREERGGLVGPRRRRRLADDGRKKNGNVVERGTHRRVSPSVGYREGGATPPSN
jgi:hypothetical protein